MSLQTGLLPRSYFVSRRSAATTPLSEPRLSRSHTQADGASNYHHGQTHARRSREVRSAIVARATEARRRRPHWSRGIPGGATAPLLVDYYFCSATSRAAAPLTVDDPFSSATGGATAPSWLALHIQAQRFKPSIDRRRPHRCGDAEVQLGDKAGASRSSPAPTRRRHHCEDTEVQPDDEAGASRSSPAPTRRRRTPPGRPPQRAAWSQRADLQLGTRARARTHVRACIAR